MSPDGRFLFYTQMDPQTRNDIWVLDEPGRVQGSESQCRSCDRSSTRAEAQFSDLEPAGRRPGRVGWPTHRMNRAVMKCMCVSSPPIAAGQHVARVEGRRNQSPVAERTGRSCSSPRPTGQSWRSMSRRAPRFATEPKRSFSVPPGIRPNWDVTPDGKRFLIAGEARPQAAPFTVWQNWQAGLKR